MTESTNVEACQNENLKTLETRDFVQKSLSKGLKQLHKKKLNESRKIFEKKCSKYDDEELSKDDAHTSTFEEISSDNVRSSRDRIRNAAHSSVKALFKKNVKESDKNTERKSLFIDARSNRSVKSLDRIRVALRKSIELLYHKKTRGSTQSIESRSDVVEHDVSEKDKPRHGPIRSVIHSVFPCLRKSKSESSVVQGSSSLTEETVDYLCRQFIRELEHAGLSAIQIQKRRAYFEITIKQMIRNLQNDLSHMDRTEATPESVILMVKMQDKDNGEEKTEELQYVSSIFAQLNVTNGLADHNLSDKMMQRLKEGFDALLASAV